MKYLIVLCLLTGCASRPRSELSVEVRAEQAERPSVVVAYRLTN
jgi:hypothetical protein